MRKIKFKFWDKDLKKMCTRKPAYNDFTHPNIVPLQFTGFKDCNGVDVYEGDKLVDLEVTLEDGVKREDTAQQVYWCAIDGCWKLDHTFKQDNSSGFPLASELRDFKFKVVSG